MWNKKIIINAGNNNIHNVFLSHFSLEMSKRTESKLRIEQEPWKTELIQIGFGSRFWWNFGSRIRQFRSTGFRIRNRIPIKFKIWNFNTTSKYYFPYILEKCPLRNLCSSEILYPKTLNLVFGLFCVILLLQIWTISNHTEWSFLCVYAFVNDTYRFKRKWVQNNKRFKFLGIFYVDTSVIWRTFLKWRFLRRNTRRTEIGTENWSETENHL